MGARAHSRRHEGRRIRRGQQEVRRIIEQGTYREWVAMMEAACASIVPVVEAAMRAMTRFGLALQASGATSEPEGAQMTNHPSEGGQAAREPSAAYAWIDEAVMTDDQS